MLRSIGFGLLLFAVRAAAQVQNEPILLSYGTPVYPPIARAARVSGRVEVNFSINTAGETNGVAATSGPAMLRGGAEAFVKGWKFNLNGVNPGEQYSTTIDYKAVERIYDPRSGPPLTVRADGHHHFEFTISVSDVTLEDCPTGADEDVPTKIIGGDFVEVSRSGCFGTCPAYSVRVQENGVVIWNGGGYVAVRGARSSRIDRDAARELIEQFRTKEFWSYCRGYSRTITDMSGTETNVTIGGKTRKIDDYAESGPQSLQDLLLAIDRASDSHQWRHGDPASEPITRIDRDLYLPKLGQTSLMLAAGRNETDRLKAFIDTGVDLNAADLSGWTALMYATCADSSAPVQILLRSGADPNQTSPHGDTALMASAANGSWDDDLVKAGAKVNSQNSDGQTALMFLASRDETDEIRSALKAGANPSLIDKIGRTALDYLKLANCGKSPLRDPVIDGRVSYTKCTAFDHDDFRAAEKLLIDASSSRR